MPPVKPPVLAESASRVILFGGGDAGGLIIGPNGVSPIPPFGPAILRQLKAIAGLLIAERELLGPEQGRQLGSLTNRLSNLVVGQIEAEVGGLAADDGLIYQDDDGGFRCGSTGKPPIPFPWPAGLPGLNQLFESGALDQATLDFVSAAASAGADVARLISDPSAEAGRVGLELPEATAKHLATLGAIEPESIADPVDREVVAFFRKAVADGSHLKDWASSPFEVAQALDVRLSRAAGDRIIAASGVRFGGRDPGAVMSPAAVAIVVVIVIVVWDRERRIPVEDRSGIEKF